MEIKAISGNIALLPIEAIVVNLFEGVKTPGGATGAVDQALGGVISRLIERGEIKGKLGEVSLLHTLGQIPSERIVVVGLGQRERFNLDRVRQATAAALRFLRKLGIKRAASILHGAGTGGIDRKLSAQAIAEGGILGLYAFKKHKTVDPEPGELEAAGAAVRWLALCLSTVDDCAQPHSATAFRCRIGSTFPPVSPLITRRCRAFPAAPGHVCQSLKMAWK